MRKMTLARVVKLEKRNTDNTIAVLGFNGYSNDEGIKLSSGHENGFSPYNVAVECKDAEAPQLGDQVLIMIESVPELGHHEWDSNKGTDNWAEYVNKRREEVSSPQVAKIEPTLSNGRKFR